MTATRIANEDRKIVIGIAIALLVALGFVVFLLEKDPGGGAYPSSYSASAGGAKAAFLLLQQTGYDVQRFHETPRSIESDPASTTLILAEPQPEDEADIAAVQKFVEGGGRVLGTGEGLAIFVKGKHFRTQIPHFDWKTYPPQEPSELTRGISHIEMTPEFGFNGENSGEAPFKQDDEIPVTRINYGKGKFIWWSSASALTNGGIRRGDNFQLLLNSVGEPQGRTVLWDEYFHEGAKTLFDSFIDSPMRWALLEAFLIGLLICFTRSRRFGPLRPLIASSRLATMDFVETLSELYKNAKAGNIAVEVVYQRFRARVQQRFSIKRNAAIEEVASGISRRAKGRDHASVTQLMQQVEYGLSDPSLDPEKATQLIRQIHQLSKDLGL